MFDPADPPSTGTATEDRALASGTEDPATNIASTLGDAEPDPLYQGKRRVAHIDRLGDEIATLTAQIQAATYEVLVRLREFDQLEGWGTHGFKSCAHWLAWRTSLDAGAAREWVRVARALEPLPILSEAMRKGEVSYSKARALTRIATPETETELVNLARCGTAAHIERIVRGCRRYAPKDERERNTRMLDSRYVQISHDEDGMVILRARLDPVAGATVERALEAAMEALFQKSPPENRAKVEPRPSAAGGACEAAGTGEPREPSEPETPRSSCRDTAAHDLTLTQRRADALVLLAESALAGGLDAGTAGDRYQVVVHVDAAVLADPAEVGLSALGNGQHVSAETSRRVACDAATVVMTHARDGSVLDVGRKTRTISPALRRALADRDHGCRFPGCLSTRCDAHHIEHWADGGATNLDNTLLLCRFHHRLLHEERFQVKRLPGGEVEFRNPRGLLVPHAPEPPRQPIDPLEALIRRLEDGAVVVDPYTGTPNWDGRPPDLGVAVAWYLSKTATPERKAHEAAALALARSIHRDVPDRGWWRDDTSWARDEGSSADPGGSPESAAA